LANYLNNSFGLAKIKTAYEAGFSGFHLHRHLVLQGVNSIVVHPGSIEVASHNRVKTDKRDAQKIAGQLAAGRLRGIFVPTTKREEMRSLTRLRANVMKLRHQIGQQLKGLLFMHGQIEPDDDTVICKKWILEKQAEIETGVFSSDFKYSISQYAEQWIQLTDRVKGIELRIKTQGEEDCTLQALYESVPGIGPVHARQLANELGDMKQFHNEKQLFSFLGLTPSEHSSGEHTRQGHITRQGNPALRKIFIETAWFAIREDESLKEIFDRISVRRGRKRAIVGIARRLAGRIRGCVLRGEFYEIRPAQEARLLQKKARPRTVIQ